MTFTSPRRKSDLHSPAASGILSSNHKSKLHTPQSKRGSRLSRLSSSKKSESGLKRYSSSSSIIASPNATVDASILPEKKNSIIDTRNVQSTKQRAAGRQSSGSYPKSSSSPEEAVKVGVRIRPLSEKDDELPRSFVLGPTDNTIIKNVESSDINAYQFNNVYGETSSTQQLYDDMVSDIVDSVGCQGRNGTVFTYGQTSSGKTHTMNGILIAAGKDLFGMIQDDRDCTCVRISCMELYNEELRDLLCNSTASLSILEDQRAQVQIPNLSERTVNSIDELSEVIQIAEEHRTVASTAMNERSSRSHTIFRITIVKKEASKVGGPCFEEDEDKENDNIHSSTSRKASQRSNQKVVTTVSTLNLVDLAGSESVRVSGAKGERQKEGGKINQRVLVKLGKKDNCHINYRDSKLTRILKPSLSGNARMGCICCISPALRYSEETKSTLDFASRTMLVTTNAKSNQTVEYDDALVAGMCCVLISPIAPSFIHLISSPRCFYHLMTATLVEEFEREIERLKMETAKAEESRRQMEQSLQDAQGQIVCLSVKAELEKSFVSSLERQNNEYMTQVEDLKASNEDITQKIMKENSELKSRADLYKEAFEASTVMYTKLQAESDNDREELHSLRASYDENDDLLGRATELEHKNAVLAEQLEIVKEDNISSQDEIVTLKSQMTTLSEEKAQVEWKLEREMQKSHKRSGEREKTEVQSVSLVGITEKLREKKWFG
ncbi:hypothetical protein ACHAXR_006850 [Thalassiosira sp. AJA248-18]